MVRCMTVESRLISGIKPREQFLQNGIHHVSVAFELLILPLCITVGLWSVELGKQQT